MITLLIASFAAGHGVSSAYLLKQLQLKPRTKLRQWQLASLVFPIGVLVAFWAESRSKKREA